MAKAPKPPGGGRKGGSKSTKPASISPRNTVKTPMKKEVKKGGAVDQSSKKLKESPAGSGGKKVGKKTEQAVQSTPPGSPGKKQQKMQKKGQGQQGQDRSPLPSVVNQPQAGKKSKLGQKNNPSPSIVEGQAKQRTGSKNPPKKEGKLGQSRVGQSQRKSVPVPNSQQSDVIFKQESPQQSAKKVGSKKAGDKDKARKSVPGQPPQSSNMKGGRGKKKSLGFLQEGQGKGQANQTTMDQDQSFDGEISARFIDALKPYAYFMKFLLRFPISYKRAENRTYYFNFKILRPAGLGFMFTSIIIGIIFILFCINLIGFFVNLPFAKACYENPGENSTGKTEIPCGGGNSNSNSSIGRSTSTSSSKPNRTAKQFRAEEEFIFYRNIIPVIVLMVSLTHVFISNLAFYQRRKLISDYFHFWTETAELLQIDVAQGVKKYMIKVLVIWGVFLLCFLAVNCIRIAPVSSGGPGILAILLTRFIDPTLYSSEDFWIYRLVASILFFYIIIASNGFVLLFVFLSKLLNTCFLDWNDRLERVLHRSEGKKSKEQRDANRTGYKHLFKDHVRLLDLIEGADHMFTNIIETFYTAQVVILCLVTYYFYRAQAGRDDFKQTRRFDAIIAGFFLAQTIGMFLILSLSASETAYNAMEGLEIIRRKNLLVKIPDEELYFMLSMYYSYTGHYETALTCGKYFTIDKSYITTTMAALFSYFIILIQFSPKIRLSDENKMAMIPDNKTLIMHVESTRQYFPGIELGY